MDRRKFGRDKKALLIYEDDGVLYFSNIQGEKFWGKINGKSPQNITSIMFNKYYGLGDKRGYLRTAEHIKGLFKLLGFKVASENEEYLKKEHLKNRFFYDHYIKKWKNDILFNSIFLKKYAQIYELGGIWYFGIGKGLKNWPKIGDTPPRNFPNLEFNRINGIGDEIGQLRSLDDMKAVFKIIGLKVASEKEEKEKYNELYILNFKENKRKSYVDFIEKNVLNLKANLGIKKHLGVWYFKECIWYRKWKNIGNVNMRNFPELEINRILGIGDKFGNISSGAELKKIFEMLGLKTATEEMEKNFKIREVNSKSKERLFKLVLETILNNKDEILKKTGIFERGGILYFCKCKSVSSIPRFIASIPKTSFPSLEFNRINGIGNEIGVIRNKNDYKKAFELLGFSIASDKQEKAMLGSLKNNLYNEVFIKKSRELIIGNVDSLGGAGITYKNGVWDLCLCKGHSLWPKIGDINLRAFPAVAFNKSRGIGDKNGVIKNKSELSKMLQALGFNTTNDKLRASKKGSKPMLDIYDEFNLDNVVILNDDYLTIFGKKYYKTPIRLYLYLGGQAQKIENRNIGKEIRDLIEIDIKAGLTDKIKFVRLSILHVVMLFFEGLLKRENITTSSLENDQVIFKNIEIKTSKGIKKIDLIVPKIDPKCIETLDEFRQAL